MAEAKLWRSLRGVQLHGKSFRRQHPAGPYVLDFYCPALQLAIELDGGQHGFAREAAKDARRTAWLQDRGVTVLRFWNNDVLSNLEGVLQVLLMEIDRLEHDGKPPTRRWRAALPLSGGGDPRTSTDI